MKIENRKKRKKIKSILIFLEFDGNQTTFDCRFATFLSVLISCSVLSFDISISLNQITNVYSFGTEQNFFPIFFFDCNSLFLRFLACRVYMWNRIEHSRRHTRKRENENQTQNSESSNEIRKQKKAKNGWTSGIKNYKLIRNCFIPLSVRFAFRQKKYFSWEIFNRFSTFYLSDLEKKINFSLEMFRYDAIETDVHTRPLR